MAKRLNSSNDFIADFFGDWRLWLLGAALGALLAAAAYSFFPPDYRARATVVVDNNLEEAWQFFPDRQLFQFLQRETERLEQLAWSDEVIERLAEAAPGVSVSELRDEDLQLSQPSDGGWHFYADAADAATAQTLAAAWAQAYVDAAQAAIVASPELQAARAALNEELLKSQPDDARIRELTEDLSQLNESTKGISLYTELYVSQAAELPTERSLSLATYLLIGSAIGALAAPLYALLRPKPRRRK
jgi:hypothetical protein